MSEDTEIRNSINSILDENLDYFSYEDVTRKEGIHNLARYPATMVPQMQKDIIEIICKSRKIKNVLDPFMGSGTVLVEGLLNGLNVYGCDINPYSYLLCSTKLTYVTPADLHHAFENILDLYYSNKPYSKYDFDKIEKWFRSDYIDDFSKLKSCISSIKNIKVRDFYNIVLSDVVTTFKNSQSSTFKLHIKKKEKIDSFDKQVIVEFTKKSMSNIESYTEYLELLKEKKLLVKKQETKMYEIKNKVKLVNGDSRNLRRDLELRRHSIDLVVTSPPYGDNKTTVTYGQYSILPLMWLKDDLLTRGVDNTLFDSFSSIDTASLGGKLYKEDYIIESGLYEKSKSLHQFCQTVETAGRPDKGRKVASFIYDFNDTLNELSELLKKDGYLVMVVGNRRVHDIEVPFDTIICELLSSNFDIVIDFNREIKNKTMARKISRVDSSSVESMIQEKTLIFKKKK